MKRSLSIIVAAFAFFACTLIATGVYAAEANDVSKAVVSLEYKTAVYDSKEKKPDVTLTVNNEDSVKTLIDGKDYTVTYSDNINVGTASAVINGIGDYSGSVKKTFKITAFDISQAGTLGVTLNYTTIQYDGELKEPIPTVKWVNNGKKVLLNPETDYTVSYGNNRKIGTARVNIKGKGNFKGTYTRNFKILPNLVKGLKASSSENTITLKWNTVEGATGYQIYTYDSTKKDFKLLKKVTSNVGTYKITGLKFAKTYKYKVRAYTYVKSTDLNYYGEFSTPITYCTRPDKVNLKAVEKTGTTIKVRWGKVSCSGYEIWYSADNAFKKGVKKIDVSGSKNVSKSIKKVNKSRKYFVKVRAYYNFNGKKYYGKFSNYLSTYYTNLYATYSSYYENNANRTNNLKIASKAITGTIIQPGETFSFNKVVGPRTSAKGYKSAHVFANGNQVVEGIGGGICQVASTMFNCALIANVQIVERHQHSQRVYYVPFGRDAAIYGTAEDFKWKNNTKYPIRIVMTVKDGVITCSFYTCKDVKPAKTSITVSQNGNRFYMKRTVKGKVNYSCTSVY